MAHALQKMKKETGLNLVMHMDDKAINGNLWDDEAQGGGRSTYGRK